MKNSSQNKAIFFDRDGIVNFRIVGDYVKSYNEMSILTDFLAFFHFIKKKGFLAILVTNQQGIGKNLMTIDDFNKVSIHMQAILKKNTGYVFDDIFFCPDLKNSDSPNRKPNPGMLLQAAIKWNIDLQSSWIIGDRETDIIAGKNAGVKTILIGNTHYKSSIKPDFSFTDLLQAKEAFTINELL